MKQVIIVIAVIIIAIISLTSFSTEAIILNEEGYYVSKYAYMHKDDFSSLDWSETQYTTPIELMFDIDEYVEEISEDLHRDDWLKAFKKLTKENDDNKIEIKFSYDTISRAYRSEIVEGKTFLHPVVVFSRKGVELGVFPLAHELTHIVSPQTESQSLDEGLACYIHDLLDETPVFPNFEMTINQMLEENYSSDYSHILNNIGSAVPDLKTSDRSERWHLYALSYSFTEYLIENHGMKAYMALYESELTEEDFLSIFDVSKEELMTSWQTHLGFLE